MYFLVPDRDLAVVPLSLVNQSPADCRTWGGAIREALAAWPERVAFIVSGLLTFNLYAWTMRREVPEAVDFDQRTLEALKAASGTISRLRRAHAAPHPAGGGVAAPGGAARLPRRRREGRGAVLRASPGAGAALISFDVAMPARAPRTAPAPAPPGWPTEEGSE